MFSSRSRRRYGRTLTIRANSTSSSLPPSSRRPVKSWSLQRLCFTFLGRLFIGIFTDQLVFLIKSIDEVLPVMIKSAKFHFGDLSMATGVHQKHEVFGFKRAQSRNGSLSPDTENFLADFQLPGSVQLPIPHLLPRNPVCRQRRHPRRIPTPARPRDEVISLELL